jgi:hypothetical protein
MKFLKTKKKQTHQRYIKNKYIKINILYLFVFLILLIVENNHNKQDTFWISISNAAAALFI